MAVTVGLLGELGYVGIDAVLVPTPPRRFGGGVREPVEIPRKLAEGVRGERNIVLQRVDMQLHNLGPSWVLIARTPYTNGWPDSVIRVPILGMVSLTGVPSGPSPKPRVHLAHHDIDCLDLPGDIIGTYEIEPIPRHWPTADNGCHRERPILS